MSRRAGRLRRVRLFPGYIFYVGQEPERDCSVKQHKRPNIVSVQLAPEGKERLDAVCDARGMTIKSILGRLIEWFCELDRTEQSIVLGQLAEVDIRTVTDLIRRRKGIAPVPLASRSRRAADR